MPRLYWFAVELWLLCLARKRIPASPGPNSVAKIGWLEIELSRPVRMMTLRFTRRRGNATMLIERTFWRDADNTVDWFIQHWWRGLLEARIKRLMDGRG
ncbi:MAG TPA: hypothetical protein PKV72_00190 [Candidatus Peribacteria bacterium]|nr:hypothetical protein [Candidatus Peribacteria bacterium]